MNTFKCQNCSQQRPIEDKRSFGMDGFVFGSCRVCEDSHMDNMRHQAACAAAWERDFGDRPVVNYDTGKQIAKTEKKLGVEPPPHRSGQR
jgi:hypothetical protein